ncbi:MAG: methyl-accepting chemotaxis protein [Candidatus Magnetoglobus multicellularis str. Araruama]|uniref:Methyl-accepting chemotaxis protein n=1 Tax=Candidatus Magnetoglobus multicellularis str. Araruama TaxID=890399 RepID=A0A1V1PH09_9BACT|nr:MAG: methyl-accepting chemotaxis protein [Candidatus Magnetoglobus multicellularis str. Araruama]
MLTKNLKTNFILGYSILTIITFSLVVVSVFQFISFEKQAKYVTEDIAHALKIASDIKSHIFSLRTAVEKFIYKAIESDKLEAEATIKKIDTFIAQDLKSLLLFCKKKDVELIQEKISSYIESFSNISVRITALQYNAQRLKKDHLDITNSFKNIIISPDNKFFSMILTHAFTQFVNAVSDIQHFMYFHNGDDAQIALEKLKVIIDQLSSCDQCEDIQFMIDDYRDNFDGFIDVSLKLDDEIYQKLLPLAPEIVNLAVDITNNGWSKMERSKNLINIKAEKTKKIIIILGSLTICLGFLMGIIMSRQILKPVKKLVQYATQVSEGDLSTTISLNTSNEIRKINDAINIIVSNFKNIVSDIINNSQQLASASDKLVGISGSLSENASEMQSQSEDVASTSTQMSNNMSTIAESIHQMNANVREVTLSSEEMSIDIQSIKDAIKTLTISMSEIDKTAIKGADTAGKAKLYAANAMKIIDQLGISADNIGEVTKIIKHIADKTNLLALNAAIEAAAAGEYGKGFGVVANAIQQFADQSNNAAEKIAVSISEVQDNIHNAVDAISDVAGVMEHLYTFSEVIQKDVDGQQKITENIFSDISSAMTKTENAAFLMREFSEGIEVISFNTSDAAAGVNTVADKIKHVNLAAKKTALIVENVQFSTTALSQMSDQLMALVNHFKVEKISG